MDWNYRLVGSQIDGDKWDTRIYIPLSRVTISPNRSCAKLVLIQSMVVRKISVSHIRIHPLTHSSCLLLLLLLPINSSNSNWQKICKHRFLHTKIYIVDYHNDHQGRTGWASLALESSYVTFLLQGTNLPC